MERARIGTVLGEGISFIISRGTVSLDEKPFSISSKKEFLCKYCVTTFQYVDICRLVRSEINLEAENAS